MGPTSRLFEGWVRDIVRDVAREHAPVYGESTGAGEKGARISVLSVVRFRKAGERRDIRSGFSVAYRRYDG